MENTSSRQSAQILMFPTAKRAAAANLSRQAKFAAQAAALPVAHTDFGDGWYHEAAIQEEARDRRN